MASAATEKIDKPLETPTCAWILGLKDLQKKKRLTVENEILESCKCWNLWIIIICLCPLLLDHLRASSRHLGDHITDHLSTRWISNLAIGILAGTSIDRHVCESK